MKLRELIEQNGGRDAVRFIIETSQLNYAPAMLGLGICMKSSSDPTDKVVFKIPNEPKNPIDLYGLDSNYKIELVPENEEDLIKYGRETFYQSDLVAIIEGGYIEISRGHHE